MTKGQGENRVMKFLLRARCLQGTGELLRYGCCPPSGGRAQAEGKSQQESFLEPKEKGITDQEVSRIWKAK